MGPLHPPRANAQPSLTTTGLVPCLISCEGAQPSLSMSTFVEKPLCRGIATETCALPWSRSPRQERCSYNTMLLLMLWEEKTPPAEAAKLLDRTISHTARVLNNFPARLGGIWKAEGAGDMAGYFRNLVRLRHRVVHAGHAPSESEADEAWQALLKLERYLGDRLAAEASLNKCPRAAFMYMGEPGLERRGRWTRKVRELTEDRTETDWVEAFSRYRIHVDRHLHLDPPVPGGSPDTLELYVVVSPTANCVGSFVIGYRCTRWNRSLPSPVFVDESLARSNEQEILELATPDDISSQRRIVRHNLAPGTDLTALPWVEEESYFPELTMFPVKVRPARSDDAGTDREGEPSEADPQGRVQPRPGLRLALGTRHRVLPRQFGG